MALSTIKFTVTALTILTLTSCSTLVEEVVSPMVTTDVYGGVSTAKPSSAKGMAKQKAKEQEQLKTDGKCPLCRGQGRSADGQYTCKACNGTGKYTANNKKE